MFFPEAAPLLSVLRDAAIAVATLMGAFILGALLYGPFRFATRAVIPARGLPLSLLRGVLGTGLAAGAAVALWRLASQTMSAAGFHPIEYVAVAASTSAGYAIFAATGRNERLHREAYDLEPDPTALLLGLDAEEAR